MVIKIDSYYSEGAQKGRIEARNNGSWRIEVKLNLVRIIEGLWVGNSGYSYNKVGT